MNENSISTPNKWSTSFSVRATFMARWEAGVFLREALSPSMIFPWRFPLKSPNASALTDSFSNAQSWVQAWVDVAEKASFTLEWKDINHRLSGRNRLPVALVFQSLDDVLRWLGRVSEVQRFIKLSKDVLDVFPDLLPWVLKNPHHVVRLAPQLPALVDILAWRKQHSVPGIYLRQLNLPGIDTKFIEQHQKCLGDWFDLVLPEENIEKTSTVFTTRYGFKAKPVQIRFRLLDDHLRIQGLSDLAIPATDFGQLDLDIDTFFVTENDINGLTFPSFPNAMVIFGRGYGFDYLSQVHWLKNKRIFYWGDIDTHGFAILSQFRGHFPQTQSFLMDTNTLLTHRIHWGFEAKPSTATLGNLSKPEANLYAQLQNGTHGDGIRLEQEHIAYSALESVLRVLNV